MNQPPLRRHDLWQHQVSAFSFASTREGSLLALSMGTGKTAIVIALMDNLPNIQHSCVVVPCSCRAVWRRELGKHSARDLEVCILDKGTVKQRTEQAEVAYNQAKPSVSVINYEASHLEPFRSWALSKQWDSITLDEGHKCQGMTKIARFVAELGPQARYRWVTSGSPLTQDPCSVWAECRFVNPAIFGHDLKAFRDKYENKYAISLRKREMHVNQILSRWPEYVEGGYEMFHIPDRLKIGTRHSDEYLRRLSRIAFRCENTVLDLPSLLVEERTFTLSDSAQSIYDAIEDGHIEEIETGRWPNVRGSFATTMRLQQITSGFLPDKNGNIVPLDNGKAELLAEILSEAAGEPVVVFTRFIQDLNTTRGVAAKLGLRYGEISGRRKDAIDDLAQMRPGYQVVGVSEEAGGTGIDLSRAHLAVDFSPSWKRAIFDQKLARIHRPPQTHPVVIYNLVAERTIDGEIHRALTSRQEIVSQVWQGLEMLKPDKYPLDWADCC